MTRFLIRIDRPSPAQFRRWLLSLLMFVFWQGAWTPHAGAQTSSDSAGTIHGDTLALHLSTNAAGYARGFTGSSDDKFALSGWRYGNYTETNIALLTNATRSKTFWLAGVRGLSATCLGYSNGMGGQGLITMVSPRHYLGATHMHPEGNLTAFLDTNNVIHWRTTLERVDLGQDISLGILNADLPPSVGFLPVLPPDFARYLPTNNYAIVQGIAMNQSWRVFGQPMTFMFPSVVAWDSRLVAPLGLGTNWNIAIRGGDSSDPDMLLVGRQLVLAAHTSTVQGANYATQFDAINRQMHYLSTKHHTGTDYQLTPFSLTNWPVVNP